MTLYLPKPVLSTWSEVIDVLTNGNGSSSAYPAANRALFFPFVLSKPYRVRQMWCINGATVSGNIDVGIYDRVGTRLVSSDSTAQSGVNTIQVFDVTDTLFGPGLFYMAIAMNNTTGTLMRIAPTAAVQRSTGSYQQATAFPLPATATFAAIATGYVPIFGLTARTII